MKWQSVDSTNLSMVRYDWINQVLRIKFLSGPEYDYFDVHPDIFEKLLRAESAGRYFNVWIKGKYKYVRVK